MTTARLSIALCATALTFGFGGTATAQASITTTVKCKTAGLGYRYRDGGVTFASSVSKLNASNGASCRVARKIARTTALAVLFSGDVPKKPEGYALSLRKPCSGCAPVWKASAKRGLRKVTFAVRGG